MPAAIKSCEGCEGCEGCSNVRKQPTISARLLDGLLFTEEALALALALALLSAAAAAAAAVTSMQLSS